MMSKLMMHMLSWLPFRLSRRHRAERTVSLRVGAIPAYTLGMLVFAVVLALLADLFLRPGHFTIERVSVVSDVPPEELKRIQRVVWESLDGNYFTVDISVIERALEGLQGVYSATVRRMWPDTLRVSVVPANTFAQWRGLSRSGNAVERAVINLPPDIPVMVGPNLRGPAGQQDRVLDIYLEARPLVRAIGLHIKSLSQGANGEWHAEVQLDAGRSTGPIELMLSRNDPMLSVRRFSRVFDAVLREHAQEIERVDLRYDAGFAVSWRLGSGRTRVKS